MEGATSLGTVAFGPTCRAEVEAQAGCNYDQMHMVGQDCYIRPYWQAYELPSRAILIRTEGAMYYKLTMLGNYAEYCQWRANHYGYDPESSRT